MKHYLIIPFLMLLASNSGLFAQAVPLFSPKPVDVQTEMKPNAGSAGMLRYRPIQFNPKALNAEQVAVELFDGQKAIFQRTPNTHTNVFEGGWSGAATGTWHGNLIVTPIKTSYRADIFWEHHYFQVFPSVNGTYFLIETDRSDMPDEDCHDLKTNPGLKSKMEDSPEASGDDPVACNIRLLVAYTNAANNWSQSNGFGDALGLAQAAINATNTTYANSQVNFRVELAHLVRVGYTESGSFATDVDRFQDPSDGNMDEIHALRDLYRADLCVLITEGNADCGRAFEIGADADEAFCAANASCCVGNFSFAHELGHLYGARHDPYADNTNTPFSFGHGFVQVSDLWRTVMAYNSECTDAGVSCARVGYWSNPNVNYPPTNQATGTAADNDNARVLNTTGSDLRSFRTQANDHNLSNTTLNGVTFADVTAVNSIVAGNNYLVETAADIRFRAGQFVRLSPGFNASPGADFRASIQPISACSGGRPAGERAQQADVAVDELLFYPNPADHWVRLQYHQATEGDVSVTIFNALGAVVAAPLQGQRQTEGQQSLGISVGHLPQGIYRCVIRYPDGRTAQKPLVVAH